MSARGKIIDVTEVPGTNVVLRQGILPKKDLLGKSVGRWSVLRYIGRDVRWGAAYWECRCICGTVRAVSGKHLLTESTVSCGCLRKETLSRISTTHGLTESDEYKVWSGMNARCYCVNATGYAWYGGRGIYVCESWRHSFETFLEDMGRRPTSLHEIDRKDNDGPYSKDNCRWATWDEQANNRSSNRIIEVRGLRKTLSQWAGSSGLRRETIQRRLNAGWTSEDAVERPVR